MQVVTSSEFSANQQKYFKLAETEPVFISRGNASPFVLGVVDDDDCLTSEELDSIKRGIADIKEGRTFKMKPDETLVEFINRTASHV